METDRKMAHPPADQPWSGEKKMRRQGKIALLTGAAAAIKGELMRLRGGASVRARG
jgi:hypothetical protein